MEPDECPPHSSPLLFFFPFFFSTKATSFLRSIYKVSCLTLESLTRTPYPKENILTFILKASVMPSHSIISDVTVRSLIIPSFPTKVGGNNVLYVRACVKYTHFVSSSIFQQENQRSKKAIDFLKKVKIFKCLFSENLYFYSLAIFL